MLLTWRFIHDTHHFILATPLPFMNENSRRPREPTVDDLRVKHCYICLEEERHDGAFSQSP